MEEKLFTTQKHCYTSCGAYTQKHFYKHWFLQRSLMEYKGVGHINIKRVNTCLISSLRKTSLLLYKLLTMRSMRRLTCHVNKIKCQIPKSKRLFSILFTVPTLWCWLYLCLILKLLRWWVGWIRCSSCWLKSATQKRLISWFKWLDGFSQCWIPSPFSISIHLLTIRYFLSVNPFPSPFLGYSKTYITIY